MHVVDFLLKLGQSAGASDLHLVPEAPAGRLSVLMRLNGVLHQIGAIPESAPNIIARLKVLAHLLTYRNDVPQEGRIRDSQENLEIRVSTFPTIHGEKAVVRLFVGTGQFRTLVDLNLPPDIEQDLQRILSQTSGLLIVCGPAGSGKTTTLYAALRHIQENSTLRAIHTLEDPVEAVLPGVSQSQVKPDGEFTYQRGLASLLRQDPEVIMVGEIRNPETAGIVFQASLTGHLVLTSFHAGGAADAISRLSDMGIEPYVLRSGLTALLAQRLLRNRCICQQAETSSCPHCQQTGYAGRIAIAELLKPDRTDLGRAILNRDDADRIHQLAVQSGMKPLRTLAQELADEGLTTQEELLRVFGPV